GENLGRGCRAQGRIPLRVRQNCKSADLWSLLIEMTDKRSPSVPTPYRSIVGMKFALLVLYPDFLRLELEEIASNGYSFCEILVASRVVNCKVLVLGNPLDDV